MDISGIGSMLGMQQDLANTTTQKTGEDFKEILDKAIDSKDDAELKKGCDGLEAYMLSMVLKQVKQSMLSNDDENALIPKGDYTKMFEETMINSVAEKMVEAGGIGLSDQIYKQIKTAYAAQMQVSEDHQAAAAAEATKVDNEV